MVVLNRVAYLRNLAQCGAKLTFSVSVNPATGVQKFKVVIDTSVQIPIEQQCCSLYMLDLLSNLCVSHRVADKGHKHTSGISEVSFYITGGFAPEQQKIIPTKIHHIVEQPAGVHTKTQDFSEQPERADVAFSRGRLVDQLVIHYPEQVPAQLTYYAVLEDPVVEHTVAESPSPTPRLCWEAQPFSFVSLPCMELLSIYDGLQAVCVSRSLCTAISALLAMHVESSGGSVEGHISLGQVSQHVQDPGRHGPRVFGDPPAQSELGGAECPQH